MSALDHQASSVCLMVSNLLNVLALQLFTSIQTLLTPAGFYWFTASICTFGIIFSFVFIVETKDKAIGQIQNMGPVFRLTSVNLLTFVHGCLRACVCELCGSWKSISSLLKGDSSTLVKKKVVCDITKPLSYSFKTHYNITIYAPEKEV